MSINNDENHTEWILKEFINRGGVITIYPNTDKKTMSNKPIRFSVKYEGNKHSGVTSCLETILDDIANPENDRDPDPMHCAPIYGYPDVIY